jgi:signal transduction histidine kinase
VTATLLVVSWAMAAAGWGVAAVSRRRSTRQLEAAARASHELRGPLTAVRLALESAFRAWRLPQARLRAIDLELARAALALEDLAAVGQRPAPASPVLHVRVDVAELLADSVEAWRGAAHAAAGEIKLVLREPAVVLADRVRLAQAVGNLLANAIEHGGALVEVTLHRDSARVRVEVRDQGPGLPAKAIRGEKRDHRSRFSPLIGKRPSNRSARGRGLAIATAVAQAHGGRLTAEPSDRGAKLVLELPAAAGQPPAGGGAPGWWRANGAARQPRC